MKLYDETLVKEFGEAVGDDIMLVQIDDELIIQIDDGTGRMCKCKVDSVRPHDGDVRIKISGAQFGTMHVSEIIYIPEIEKWEPVVEHPYHNNNNRRVNITFLKNLSLQNKA